jgi:hypothetical protein
MALEELIGLEREYTDVMREREEAAAEIRENEKTAREERLAREAQEREELEEARQKEIEQVKELGEIWQSTMDRTAQVAGKQNKAIGLLAKATGSAINAATTAEKNHASAVTSALADVGSAISEEAGWQALMEAAKAIAAAASQNYIAAAAHGAAAVMFGVVAASSGGGGGGKSAPKESAASRQSERFSAESAGGASAGRDNNGGGNVNVNIQMKEGSGGFFDAMVEENDRASMDGRRNFAGN